MLWTTVVQKTKFSAKSQSLCLKFIIDSMLSIFKEILIKRFEAGHC
jgi:hypothetical protein